MTEKRFKAHIFDDGINERYHDGIIDNENDENVIRNYQYISNLLNKLNDENIELHIQNDFLKDENQHMRDVINENEQLKQYKQSVNDVLKSWSQKNLTAKQLQVVLAIMKELNVLGDDE